MNIGRYSLSRMNDGSWNIQWLDRETRHQHILNVGDIEYLFDTLVVPKERLRQEFVAIFRQSVMDPFIFSHEDYCLELVSRMPRMDVPNWIPDGMSNYERFVKMLTMWVNAFNAWKSESLQVSEVEPYLLDVRRDIEKGCE